MSETLVDETGEAGIAPYVPGEWIIDPTHTQITFTLRHTLVQVRCAFLDFSGTIVTADDIEDSHVEVTIKTASFSTGFPYRDGRVSKFPDLLACETFPEITYKSTRVTAQGNGRYWIDGELTVLGVTRPVSLDTSPLGFSKDPEYGTRAGFAATARFDRRDFGLTADTPRLAASRELSDGNRMLGFTIDVDIQLEAVSIADTGRYGLDRIVGKK